jgi:pimeloyl-ACP methyl ester carboxylesterase
MTRARQVRVALLTLAACLASAPGVSAADGPQPCRITGIKNEVQCGKVLRPLDPARPDGPRIEVHYVVVPAMARRKLPDPVVLLAGGPGQSAIAVAPATMGLFARLNNRRDIVFVDQRGTGRSAPLECEDTRHSPLSEIGDLERQVARVLECKTKLVALPHVRQESELRFFTTSLAMQDLEAVRLQLGAPQLNLVGGSYGTRAALEYMRQFPQAVRRAVLDGVVPPDMHLATSVSPDSQAALDALLASCAEEPVCAKSFPRLADDWKALLASLPKPAMVVHPLNGQRESLMLTRELLMGLVRGPLYAPALASALPAAITEAAQGRYEALGGLAALLGTRRATQMAMGMHFSVVCAEDLPPAGASLEAPGVDFGRDFERLYERVCAQWPRGAVPERFTEVPKFPRAVLLLSGGLDPVTPPRHGERVAQALGASAQHVIVPNAGHGVMAIGCTRDVVFRFIDAPGDKPVPPVDAACVRPIPRPLAFMPLAGGKDVPK